MLGLPRFGAEQAEQERILIDATDIQIVQGNTGRLPTNHHRLGTFVTMLENGTAAEISRVPLESFLKSPRSYYGEDTVVAVAGGDGSLNSVVGRLLEDGAHQDTEADLPRILVLPIGKTNEVARMLDGFDTETHQTKSRPQTHNPIQFHGIYPIRLAFHSLEGEAPRNEYSIYCALIGNPARASRVYDNSVYRRFTRFPLVGRAAEVAVAAVCATFPASHRIKNAGKQSAIIALGGHTAARYMRSPADLREPNVAVCEQLAHPPAIIANSLNMMLNPIDPPFLVLDQRASVTYSFSRDHLPKDYSLDGQPYSWRPNETTLTISASDIPVRIGVLRARH
jgi:diacylglycerol kinase family enzyme